MSRTAPHTSKHSTTLRALVGLFAATAAPAAFATLISAGQVQDYGGNNINPTAIHSNTQVKIANDQDGSISINGDPFTGNGITSVFAYKVSIGDKPDTFGRLNISGFGASWNQDYTYGAEVYLGFEGEGELNLSNGGRLTSLGPTYLGGSSYRYSSTGYGSGAGYANISGTGTQLVTEDLHIGSATNGTGEVHLSNGAAINNLNDWVYIGYHANATGNLLVEGATTQHYNMSGMWIARDGRGTMEIRNAGQVIGTTSTGTSVIGVTNGSLGRVIVTGRDSTWQDTNQNLFVGDAGSANLEIGRGGVVNFDRDVTVGNSATGRGQIVFNVGRDKPGGAIQSGKLVVGDTLDIGSGFGLIKVDVDPDVRQHVDFGDQFTLVDYGTYTGDMFLKNELGVTGFLADGGTVTSDNGVQFIIDLDSDLTGTGDYGITATLSRFIGDFDGDRDVDDSDLGTAFANYTGPVGFAGGKTYQQGDIDGDGDVDDSDLGSSFAFYTGPYAAANAAVPEPGSLALLALGGVLIARRRRG